MDLDIFSQIRAIFYWLKMSGRLMASQHFLVVSYACSNQAHSVNVHETPAVLSSSPDQPSRYLELHLDLHPRPEGALSGVSEDHRSKKGPFGLKKKHSRG